MMRQARDKEQTKRKLIDAVGQVLRDKGYKSLGVNVVARQAGVDKVLIYRYFKTFDRLIEAYVVETDYWMLFADQISQLSIPKDAVGMRKLVGDLLKNQFRYFYGNKERQELILWELSSNSDLMRSIHRTREAMSQPLLELTDNYIDRNLVDFRAIAALLVGGIYYTVLHSRSNGGVISEVNVLSNEGHDQITNGIDSILELVFKAGA
jgi:AcrR family transcriptional regulator